MYWARLKAVSGILYCDRECLSLLSKLNFPSSETRKNIVYLFILKSGDRVYSEFLVWTWPDLYCSRQTMSSLCSIVPFIRQENFLTVLPVGTLSQKSAKNDIKQLTVCDQLPCLKCSVPLWEFLSSGKNQLTSKQTKHERKIVPLWSNSECFPTVQQICWCNSTYQSWDR